MNLKHFLNRHFSDAMANCGFPEGTDAKVVVGSKFSDYQSNGVIGSSKALGMDAPNKAVELVAELLRQPQSLIVYQELEAVGPGFINIQLRDNWIAKQLSLMLQSDSLGVQPASSAETIVIDYSSPNLAKEMHVGHLRGTIIGDAIARILQFLGHTVIRQNHIGDWGTQFGMLIAELEEQQQKDELKLDDLEVFYRQAKEHFDQDAHFAQRARETVVKLQSGDSRCRALWQRFISISIDHCHHLYRRLGVTLTPEHIKPESAYNESLATIVKELQERQLVVTDQGAKVIFLPECKNREEDTAAVIVQKADGGYLYITTDLAALRYRIEQLQATRLLYFVDARQSLHLRQLFAIATRAGWADSRQQLKHCAFGTMMGKDGKPFKTRSGETVKLASLLDEAEQRAQQLVTEKNPKLSEAARQQIAVRVGIGAVKYADLCKTRTHDYIFDWDSILSLERNTAPYLQYAYTRIASLLRKADYRFDRATAVDWVLKDAIERKLALQLLRFNEVVDQVADNAYPHELCHYLFELASLFMTFYEACPVLGSSDPNVRKSRLQSCLLTSKVLSTGLGLLGIETMEFM